MLPPFKPDSMPYDRPVLPLGIHSADIKPSKKTEPPSYSPELKVPMPTIPLKIIVLRVFSTATADRTNAIKNNIPKTNFFINPILV
jgi:hypothetical protein